mgnify:CR=1 FL=1
MRVVLAVCGGVFLAVLLLTPVVIWTHKGSNETALTTRIEQLEKENSKLKDAVQTLDTKLNQIIKKIQAEEDKKYETKLAEHPTRHPVRVLGDQYRF